jgi:hypothetical protein
MLQQQVRPIYDYRGHYIVLMANGAAFVYRGMLAGEGSPRLNVLPAPDGYQAALAWVDRQLPPSTVRARPDIFRGNMPRYIADDLPRPAGCYVIEHPTRGCFVGTNAEYGKPSKARFRWSIPRTDKSIIRYADRAKADKMLETLGVKRCYVVALGG